jgi:hypothetical protein
MSDEVDKNGERSCAGIKSAGVRCQAKVQAGSAYCFFHDPKKSKTRKAAQRLGGSRNRAVVLGPGAPQVELGSLSDVAKVLTETINQVRRGELDYKVGYSVGYLCALTMKALDGSQLEERLGVLERALKVKPASRPLFDASMSSNG